jgi:CRISPR/Cas system-associated endonuclease Cas1
LGFLHSIQHGKPSLVSDFQELYRYLIDDFLIERIKVGEMQTIDTFISEVILLFAKLLGKKGIY